MANTSSELLLIARHCGQRLTSNPIRRRAQPMRCEFLPLRTPTYRPSTCTAPRASFTTARPWQAEEAGDKKKKPSQSYRVKQMMAESQKAVTGAAILEHDVGIINAPFIMPTGKNLPSWWSDLRLRGRIEWKRVKSRFREVGACLIYKWYTRPWPKFRYSGVPAMAEDLQKRMYEHVAAGDLQPMDSQLCPGIKASLRRRISQRAVGTQLKWTLHKYLSRTRVVSFMPVMINPPKTEKPTERNAMWQAVVRIHSKQSLETLRIARRKPKAYMSSIQGEDERGEDGQRHMKESVEYVVLQKAIKKGQEGQWKLWGTTEEMSIADFEKAEGKSRGKSEEKSNAAAPAR